MKKITKLLLSALFIALLIFFGTSCKHPTNREIKNAAIAILKEKIDYKDKDKIYVTELDNRFGSIEIRTQKTAEMLFSCIRNSKKIVDFTGIKIEKNYCNVAVSSGDICNFDGIYIEIPQFDKTYYIEFPKAESKAFREYAKKLVNDLPTYQEIKDATIAILQNKMVYGDKDEISIFLSGKLQSIDIKTKETAEMLFHCIRNSKKIYDNTGSIVEMIYPCPVEIAGEGICNFYGIDIYIPQFDRLYYISFEDDDSEIFNEYVMRVAKVKDEPPTEKEAIDAIVAVIKERINYEKEDGIYTSPNDELEGIIIQAPKTVEQLLDCIRNSQKIEDIMGESAQTKPSGPIMIGGERIGDFSSVCVYVPQFGGYYRVVFTESDAAALQEHVMKLKNALPTKQEIKDAVIAILEDKIVYGDQDIVTKSGEIEIKTPVAAELLFRCIRNSENIVDYTYGSSNPVNWGVYIAGERVSSFYSMYIRIPQFGRFYCIEFNSSDSSALIDYKNIVKNGMPTPTIREIKDAAIAILKNKMVRGDRDELSISPNGELESIEIKTKRTAELLYCCILNSEKIVDFTGVDFEPMPQAPIKIAGAESCYFDSIFINIPNYYRGYQIMFIESDAAALQEHVMKLKDDYIGGQSKQ